MYTEEQVKAVADRLEQYFVLKKGVDGFYLRSCEVCNAFMECTSSRIKSDETCLIWECPFYPDEPLFFVPEDALQEECRYDLDRAPSLTAVFVSNLQGFETLHLWCQ